MVENLLSITRMSNESTLLSRQPEVVEEVVGGAVQKFRRRYPAVRITVRPPEQFAVVLMGRHADGAGAHQFDGECRNSRKKHHQHHHFVCTALRPGTQRSTVADDGGGVDPRIIDRILEDSFSQIRQGADGCKAQHGDRPFRMPLHCCRPWRDNGRAKYGAGGGVYCDAAAAAGGI